VHQIFALILCRKRQIIKIYAWLPEKGGVILYKTGGFRGSRYTGAPDFIYARSAFDSCDDHLMTRMRFALMSQRLFSATIINISLDFALKWLPEFIIEQSVWWFSGGESKKGASTCGTLIQKDRGQLSALCVYLSLARGGGLQMGRGGQMACTSAKQLLNYPPTRAGAATLSQIQR